MLKELALDERVSKCNSGQLLDKLCIGLDLRLAGQE
jgi:hypothetical protein